MPITSQLLTYLCRWQCLNHLHCSKKYYDCIKGCGLICSQCENQAKYLLFIYQHKCLIHFIQQFKQFIHYWETNFIIIYNIYSKTSSKIAISEIIDSCSQSISHQSKIFFIGGNLLDNVYQFNYISKLMTQKSPMLMKKLAFALCKAKEIIYSLAGYDSHQVLSDCQRYSISQDKWEQLPSLQKKRECPAAFAFNNKDIYVIGGYNKTRLDTIEKMAKDKWVYISIEGIPCMSCIDAIQIGRSEVLVFGCEKGICVIRMHCFKRFKQCISEVV